MPSGPWGLRAFVVQGPAVRAQLVCMVALVFGFSFVRATALSEVEDRSNLNVYGNALIGLAAVAALAWSAFRARGGRARGKGDGGASTADFTIPFSVVIPVVATLAVLHAAFFVILALLPTVARRGLSTCDKAGSQGDPETFALLLGAGTFGSVGVSTLLSWVVYRNSAVSVKTLLVCALAITHVMAIAYAFLQREVRSARHHEVLVEEARMAQPPCEPQAGPTRHEAVERIAQTYLLTGRESDVLLLLARGYSQRGIAGRLDVSDNTVRTHLRNLYRKLQIHSRQEAIELVERERAQGR